MVFKLSDKNKMFWFGAVFLLGVLVGPKLGVSSLFHQVSVKALPKEWRQGQQGLINPLLGVNYPDNTIFEELNPLKKSLGELVQGEIKNKKADRISVYFKDQTTGHWTGVNETETFAPASLIKIPMMITYFKVAEDQPEILNKLIRYAGPDQNKVETFKPAKQMVIGQYYSVDDLIESMIVYSDNNAISMLFNNMDKKKLSDIFSDLSITVPHDINQEGDFITPRNFSRFLRTLYNATYLDENYSQKALGLLARSEFKAGLVAGVPVGITVAHKFGETPEVDQNGKTVGYELHDCGIVYAPDHPFLLCVMTSGQSYDSLANVIKDISTVVYSTVQNNYK